jgi:hypothetical protein
MKNILKSSPTPATAAKFKFLKSSLFTPVIASEILSLMVVDIFGPTKTRRLFEKPLLGLNNLRPTKMGTFILLVVISPISPILNFFPV